ncbi:uncharacterized protein TNCV_4022351 [Trichonephila clavipes]|nr:uncharacterized protein TNCV_4022351 [Trichonephila clavipes]
MSSGNSLSKFNHSVQGGTQVDSHKMKEKIRENRRNGSLHWRHLSLKRNEVHCKMCNSGLDMQVLKGKSGLAITFVLKCFACPYRVEFSSSNFHEGTQITTINTRFCVCYAFNWKRCRSRRMFCGVMNLPQPPTRFSPYGKRILNAAKLVYEDSIQIAAKEAICENEGNKNIAVAVDGTWQKRGYTSLNGVVTVTSIDTGKVIDVDILSKYCACKNLPFHEKDCKRNYVGSSGAMEIQRCV